MPHTVNITVCRRLSKCRRVDESECNVSVRHVSERMSDEYQYLCLDMLKSLYSIPTLIR